MAHNDSRRSRNIFEYPKVSEILERPPERVNDNLFAINLSVDLLLATSLMGLVQISLARK